jgi:hypothetical protein
VELYAHTLATLLDRHFLRRAPRTHEALLTFGLGLLATLGLIVLSFGRGLLLVVLAAVAWWETCQRAFAGDALWPVVGPLLALGLPWIGCQVTRSVEETRRRRWVQGLFGRYVAREIVEHLLANPAHLRLGAASVRSVFSSWTFGATPRRPRGAHRQR